MNKTMVEKGISVRGWKWTVAAKVPGTPAAKGRTGNRRKRQIPRL